tara:strand:- start:8148 stop:8327 length:180 start_codon:yes stop_codon:yes gene_type:complete
MISPSKKFVAGLPYGKIPDRSDFTKLDADTRIKYWNTVFSETEKLAEDFDKKLKTRTYY